ncbi:matrin-3-like isoform X2 [Polypterus senegalus]|uniref:matrin-3-like isoform X2 n=1 Tax=Polypterus senegalus TaxID=55291 RepID=UPI0019630D0D|nr:matrin-3-like isoform X2 [Polypterus senegalus]
MSRPISFDGGMMDMSSGLGLLNAAVNLNTTTTQASTSQSSVQMERLNLGMKPRLYMEEPSRLFSTGSSHSITSHDVGNRGQMAPEFPAKKSRSLSANLGISPENFADLADISKDNLSSEMLSHLIMQIKARKAEKSNFTDHLTDDQSSHAIPHRDPGEDWETVRHRRIDNYYKSPGFDDVRKRRYDPVDEIRSQTYDRLDSDEWIGGNSNNRSSESSRAHGRLDCDLMGPKYDSLRSKVEKRKGSPSLYMIEDYHGKMPRTFPHICSLCDFEVLSKKVWNRHLDGVLHTESCQILLDMYPDWIPDRMPSCSLESSDSRLYRSSSVDFASSASRRARINRDWSTDESSIPSSRSRPENTPPRPQDYAVVYFSNLPPVNDAEVALKEVAECFGPVRNTLILRNGAFVEMVHCAHAEMMAKYYTHNVLKIKDVKINVRLCYKYKRLRIYPVLQRSREISSRQRRSKSRSRGKERSRTQERVTRNKRDDSQKKELKANKNAGDDVKILENKVLEKQETVSENLKDKILHNTVCPDKQVAAASGQSEDVCLEETVCKSEKNETHSEIFKETELNAEPQSKEGDKTNKSKDILLKGTEVKMELTVDDTLESKDESDCMKSLSTTKPVESATQSEEIKLEEMSVPNEEEFLDPDFPDTIEDLVTLDEVGDEEERMNHSSSRDPLRQEQGGRVVTVTHYEKLNNYESEILRLVEPFGKVMNYMVLHEKKVSLLELDSTDAANKMVNHYRENEGLVCGLPVKVNLSQTYRKVKNTGRVICLTCLPSSWYTDKEVLRLAKPFGKVICYFLLRLRGEAFLEMKSWDSAFKMFQAYTEKPPHLNRKKIYVSLSNKYAKLFKGFKPQSPSPERDDFPKRSKRNYSESHKDSRRSKEDTTTPSGKRMCTSRSRRSPRRLSKEKEESAIRKTKKEVDELVESKNDSAPLMDHSDKGTVLEDIIPESVITDTSEKEDEQNEISENSEEPVAVGYYCKLCNLFYTNEHTAKVKHCTSLTHRAKVKEAEETEALEK